MEWKNDKKAGKCLCAVVIGVGMFVFMAACSMQQSGVRSGTEESTGLSETETSAKETLGIQIQIETASDMETVSDIETSSAAEIETMIPEMSTEEQRETMKLGDGYVPELLEDFLIDENADEFFEGSVFVGDSVMKGFCIYTLKQESGFLRDPQFLVSGSYSLRMAMTPIGNNTIHPIYMGEQHLIQDSIRMMGAKKAFLFFGLNDLGMDEVDHVYELYLKVIEQIKEQSPQTEIYIISTTYMRIGSEKQDLNNSNIRALNQKMKEYSNEGKVGYIEIAEYLADDEGGLRQDYCSDGYVHQTNTAYEVWTRILRCYASGGNILYQDAESGDANQEETQTEEETTAAGL